MVSYGTERGQLKQVAKAEGIKSEHVVQLSGLQPSTTYYYSVGSTPLAPPAPGKAAVEDGPGRPSTYSFTTPPPVGPAKPTRIWVLGDPGT